MHIHQIGKMNRQSDHKISEHKWKFSRYVHIYGVCTYVRMYVCSILIPTKQFKYVMRIVQEPVRSTNIHM